MVQVVNAIHVHGLEWCWALLMAFIPLDGRFSPLTPKPVSENELEEGLGARKGGRPWREDLS